MTFQNGNFHLILTGHAHPEELLGPRQKYHHFI